MSSGIARQGDTDNFGHTITGGCDAGVMIDGKPVAVKGSTMDDGVSITGGTIAGVTINGVPVAVIGSTTDPHTQDPGLNQSGTIQTGDAGVTAS
jgi:uncharacterized Zn-binding protein involved in type VI secretion